MKIKDVIQIEDNYYVVVSILDYFGIKYAYLINEKNFNDILFAEVHGTKLEKVEDKELLKELIKLFNKEINKQKLSEN